MWTAWRSAHDWGEEEELEAPTTTNIRGGAHPPLLSQVLGRTVALTTSTTITGQNCLRILKNLPEQYQVHPLSQITHTKAKVDFISHWTDAFILGKTIWHFGAHQIVNSLVGYSSRKHMGLWIRFQPTHKRQQAIQVIALSKRHVKQS